MKMKWVKRISGVLLCACAATVTAPANAGLVFFSRANCINNESISWDWPGNNRWLWTNSFHLKNGRWEEPIRTGWEYGYRSGAVHWFEGLNRGYFVTGNHFQFLPGYGEVHLGRTETTHCNIGFFFPYW